MAKRTLKVGLLAVLTLCLVLGMSSIALADQTWSDLPDSVTAKYGITDNQVAAISDGYADGLWKPYQNITREQFTKLAVAAFNIPLVNAATPSFTDVPSTSLYYSYIEGAKAAHIINGVTLTTFEPRANITRQQAVAIIARYVALKAGYDLGSLPSDWINARLAHFGDAGSISPDLRDEVAFAYEMGITQGNDYGNFAPLRNLTRIQAAAMLIRAQALVPPAQWTAAQLELVSAGNTEELIGRQNQVTFKVTDAYGNPAAGVLVDFDLIMADPYYVGNISPQAAVTNSDGEVTVTLISTEPGTQRVAARVNGVGAVYTTQYWLAMDEIYILASEEERAGVENNVSDDLADAHPFSARVVVVGPGPRSTSQFDWYNVIDAAYDPENLQVDDGRLESLNSYEDELTLADDEKPRTMAGIGVKWELINVVNNNPATEADETVPSVGNIVQLDGAEITPATTAYGTTDAEGVSSIAILSTKIGKTVVQATATYPENPYPQMLLDRGTIDAAHWEGDGNWEQQPKAVASATKIWLPSVIGGDSDVPITPAYAVNNTGEVEEFTLTLKDIYDNPIEGYTVMWWIQGVGEFKTTGASWSGTGEQNKQWDITNANGEAKVQVKSLVPGQTIVHCKVIDKYGLPYKAWNVVKQWYSIDEVSFVESAAENEVNNPHTFTVQVSGAKYVHTMYDLNGNGLSDDQVLIGDRDDIKAAVGHVAVMKNNVLTWVAKPAGQDILPGQVFTESLSVEVLTSQTPNDELSSGPYYTRYLHTELSGAEYWVDGLGNDGIDEVWCGLAGKTVYFFNNVGSGDAPTSDTPLPVVVSEKDLPQYVGSITSATEVVTDEEGYASVTINSLNKGYQYVYAVADYTDNPQDGNPLKPTQWHELRWDVATKTWTPAAAPLTIKLFEAGDPNVEGNRWVNPVDPDPESGEAPGEATLAVQVFDQYGNALEGYKVVWEIMGQGTTTSGTEPTYHPYAHLADPAHDEPSTGGGAADTGDRNPNVDSNPEWGGSADDDDYAWGWTLDHQIDFTLDTASAAHVKLVLDETAESLGESGANHFTTIVNIRVYSPTDALVGQYEVTKVWSLDDRVPSALELEGTKLTTSVDALADVSQGDVLATYGTDPMVIDNSVVKAYAFRFHALDQFGEVMNWADGGTPDNLKLKVTSTDNAAYNRIEELGPGFWATGAPDYTGNPAGFGPFTEGWAYIFGNNTSLVQTGTGLGDMPLTPAIVSLQVWLDADADDVVDDAEVKSNVLNVEIVG